MGGLDVILIMARSSPQPTAKATIPIGSGRAPAHGAVAPEAAYGYPRDFLNNKYVYLVISPRAGGLSIGVNVNPVLQCTFDCVYCEINRGLPSRAPRFDVEKMAGELRGTFTLATGGGLRQLPRYAHLPEDLLQVRHVSISGDGEPTLSNFFTDALEAIIHLRVIGALPFFKVVVITNSSALDRPEVQRGLKLLTREDEIWAKLDAGTQEYMDRVNRASVPLDKIMGNILTLGRQRPVVIQSLFPAINGEPPPAREIKQYAGRLKELKDAGAEIPLVQIYSATRPMARTGSTHLPLKSLSEIARTVRRVAGLRAEVY
jgi:wyosine [tRNA(Phe)-imidazoG37] synthetase (radical SAM superfamily)